MSGVVKPAVSPAALRVAIIVGGATVAVVTKVIDVLSDNPEIGWRALAFAAFSALATYAMKFKSDYSAKELEKILPLETRQSLVDGVKPLPPIETTQAEGTL